MTGVPVPLAVVRITAGVSAVLLLLSAFGGPAVAPQVFTALQLSLGGVVAVTLRGPSFLDAVPAARWAVAFGAGWSATQVGAVLAITAAGGFGWAGPLVNAPVIQKGGFTAAVFACASAVVLRRAALQDPVARSAR